MPPKAKPKPKIKIKVKKLSKKQLENKATECLKDLHKTYTEFQGKFQNIIRDCSNKNPDKDKLKTELFNTVHSISHVLSKAVPLELRNSPNDHSKQIKQLLNNWIKESSTKKDSKKSISYTGIVKQFIEASLSPEGTVRFSRTKKNSDSVYRPLDVRNIINPTADDKQCDIAFGTDNWPGTHKCYICGLCLHNMQSDKCGAPCEHLLNIYQVMITFGFIETEDSATIDDTDVRKNIYAPSCTCCNSEKSNIEIISFKNNNWQVNENNVDMLLHQVQNSKRECCYKDGHPEEPSKNKGNNGKVWAKSINKDNCDDREDNLIQFPGEQHTRPLYGVDLNDRKVKIVEMLNKRVTVLNQQVPRPRTTKNMLQLNALIQIATFFTHISFNAYKKIAVEMVGRTRGGNPTGDDDDDGDDSDDSEYEFCSDTDADCCDDTDTDCINIEFKKLFEFYFWKEIKEFIKFIKSTTASVTLDGINTLLPSDIFNGDFEDYQLNGICSTNDIQTVYYTLFMDTEDQAMKKAAPAMKIAAPQAMKKAAQAMKKAAPQAMKKAAPAMKIEAPQAMKIEAPQAMKKAAPAMKIAEPAMKIAEPAAMKIAAALKISPKWKPIGGIPFTYFDSQHTDSEHNDSQLSDYSSGIGTEDVNKYSSDSQSQPSSEGEDDDYTEELTGFIQTGVNTSSKRSSSSPHAPVGIESPSKRASPFTFQFGPSTTNRPSSVNPHMNKEHPQLGPPSWSRSRSAPTYHGDYGGGTKTRKNKTKKQNKTRKQKPKKTKKTKKQTKQTKQTKRVSYVKNKQTRKNKKESKNPIQKKQHKNT